MSPKWPLIRSKQKRRALPKWGARQVVKTEIRLWYFCGQTRNRRSLHCGDTRFGGPDRIRTDDPHNAKRHLNLFCIIFNYLWCFPLGFSFFPPLFGTLISMCYAAVCGASCGQKHSPPFAGNGCPAWTGSIFMPLIACIVTLRSKLSKSFLYRLYLRNWRAVNNKEAFCSRRLRKLKRIFMRFPHSL